MIIQSLTKPNDTRVTLEVNGKAVLYYSQITPWQYECLAYPEYSNDDYIHQEAYTLMNVLFDEDEDENAALDDLIDSKDVNEKTFIIKSKTIQETLTKLIVEVFTEVKGHHTKPEINLLSNEVVIDGFDVAHVNSGHLEPYNDMAYGYVIDSYLTSVKGLKRSFYGFDLEADPVETIKEALKHYGLLK